MEIDEFKTLKKYYETAKGKTTCEQLLILFCDNLRNIFGGCKQENQAILHAQHVRRILEKFDPKGGDELLRETVASMSGRFGPSLFLTLKNLAQEPSRHT